MGGHTVADLGTSVVGLGVTIRNSVLDIPSVKGMVDIQWSLSNGQLDVGV